LKETQSLPYQVHERHGHPYHYTPLLNPPFFIVILKINGEPKLRLKGGIKMKSVNMTREVKDFDYAKEAAWEVARGKIGPDVTLWAWHDAKTGKHSPPVDCCGDECNPAWVIYAKSRGGNLEVVVDDGRFKFYFGPSFG